jgi:putative peptidoglycan lipid II flippase
VTEAVGAGTGTSRATTLARAGLIVTLAFLASRVLGWVRVAVISTQFGATGELDAFFAAFRIPDLMFQLVAAGALGSALIPIVASLTASDQHARAWRVVSTVTNLMLLVLLALAVIVAVAAPALVPLYTPGFDVIQTARTVELTRIMLLSPILLALGAVATSVLNAHGRFGASAIAPIVYNLAIIGGAILLAPTLGVEGVALGVVVGALGHLAIQLWPLLRTGFRYEPVIELGDPQGRQAFALLAPRAVGLGVSQITFIVATTLASVLGPGAITAFNIAFTLLQIPIGVIGVPLGVVMFPTLARDFATGAATEYLALLTRSLRLLLYVMLPIAGLLIVLRRQVVTVLFDYGRFDDRAIDLTANTLLFFLLGLAAHSTIAVLARAFYARQDTRTPVLAAILAVAVNTTLAVILSLPLGLSGIALAIAIGAWSEAIVLLVLLRRRLPALPVGGIVRVLLEAGLATFIAAALSLGTVYLVDGLIGTDPGKLALLAQMILAGAVFGVTYLVLSLALRIPELPAIIRVMSHVLRRP